jgi:hypothetical protein
MFLRSRERGSALEGARDQSQCGPDSQYSDDREHDAEKPYLSGVSDGPSHRWRWLGERGTSCSELICDPTEIEREPKASRDENQPKDDAHGYVASGAERRPAFTFLQRSVLRPKAGS